MWSLRAERGSDPVIEERYERQGTAYRRARQLYMAGYRITAVQYSVEEPPQPVAVFTFDGIRFKRIPRAR
jgi:hypothetical protein